MTTDGGVWEPSWLKNVEIREEIVGKIIGRLTRQGLHHEGLFIDKGDTKKVAALYRSFAAHSFEPAFSQCGAIELAAAFKRYLCQSATPFLLRYPLAHSSLSSQPAASRSLNSPRSSPSHFRPLSPTPAQSPSPTSPRQRLPPSPFCSSPPPIPSSPSPPLFSSPPSPSISATSSSFLSLAYPPPPPPPSFSDSPLSNSSSNLSSTLSSTLSNSSSSNSSSNSSSTNSSSNSSSTLSSTIQSTSESLSGCTSPAVDTPFVRDSDKEATSSSEVRSMGSVSPGDLLSGASPSGRPSSPLVKLSLDEALCYAFVRRSGGPTGEPADNPSLPGRTGYAVDLLRIQEILALFLPAKQRRVLMLVIPFFRRVIALSEFNGVDVDSMAQILVRTLFSDFDADAATPPPALLVHGRRSMFIVQQQQLQLQQQQQQQARNDGGDGVGLFEFSLRLELAKCLIQFYSNIFEESRGDRRLTRTAFYLATQQQPPQQTSDTDSDSHSDSDLSQPHSALSRELRDATPQIVSVDEQTDEDSWPQNVAIDAKPRKGSDFGASAEDDVRAELTTADSSIVQIYVTAPELVKGLRDYVAYRVVSNSKDEVLRRFSQFQRLQKSLVAAYPHIPVPEMPPKQFWGRFSASFVESRRQSLQTLMNHILAFSALRDSPQLREFLSEGYPQ